MDAKRATRISKLLSYGLRHAPREVGLHLDEGGWADVASVLSALADRGEVVNVAELQEIVRSSDKQRFALAEDGRRIRANQGHSVSVDLRLVAQEPPPVLFHGTVDRFVARIRAAGLVPGSRMHVHLSSDEGTARSVADRRSGVTVILAVGAEAMHREGFELYRSANGVWLTRHVPARFVRVLAP